MREQPSEEQDQDQDNLELDLDEHTTTYTHPLPLQHPLQPSLELVDLHDDEQLHTVPQSHSAEDELASYGALDLSAAAFDNIDPFLMQASHLHRQPTHPEPSRHFGAILDAIGAASDTLPPHQNSSDMALFETPEWSTSRQAQRTQKRKRTDSDTGVDAYSKLRKTIHDRVLRTDVAARNVTTITAYHAAAAQKSYGQEKRFLCPPPLVRITGPLVPHLRDQTLKMSVLSEMGVTLQESLAPYDLEHGLVCFKQLHISSQGKDKQFQLLLTLTDTSTDNEERTGSTSASNSNDLSEGGTIQVGTEPKKPWVTLPSLPVHIISKPSKKTTRGNTPGVSNFGSVALFNRINSQTVRTKYLSSNDDGFTTSSSHWAPFEVEVVGADSALAPVVYGSRIVLKGTNGYRSHEYVIRKVEKHRSLAVDAGRQVSQMQKIALMRADLGPTPDGKVTYLSALVERSSVDIAVLPGSTHSTSWQLCEIKTQTGEDGNVSEYHEVNDYATWMITSIGKFECSFFDASGTNGIPPTVTTINPAPSVNGPIRYRAPELQAPEHSLELSVSDFFYNSPLGTREQMEVMLGDIGPLKVNHFDSPLHHMSATGSEGGPGSGSGSGGAYVHASSTILGTSSNISAQPIIHHVNSIEGLNQLNQINQINPLNSPNVVLPNVDGSVDLSMNGPGTYVYVSDRSQLNPTILPTFSAHPHPTHLLNMNALHGIGSSNLREPSLASFLVAFLPQMRTILRALLESVRNEDGPSRTNGHASGRRSWNSTLNGGKDDQSPVAPPSSIFGDVNGGEDSDSRNHNRNGDPTNVNSSNQSTDEDADLIYVEDGEERDKFNQSNQSHQSNRSGSGRSGRNERLEWDDDVWRKNPSLPILFIRKSDGIGFHSGWVLKCAPNFPLGTALPDPNRWAQMSDVARWAAYVEKVPSPVHPFDGSVYDD